MSSAKVASHLRLLRVLSVVSWIITATIAHLAALLPLFDSSPFTLLSNDRSWTHFFAAPLLRWDAFHFAHIAKEGYVYEYEWAFLPGISYLMRAGAYTIRFLTFQQSEPSWETILLAGGLATFLCSLGSVTTLYKLTLHHLGSPSVALLVSLLSLLPSSPATLRLAGYTEPFFTYLSYKGMLCCARSEWFRAACWFALASTFRSNGITLSGFIIWGLFVEPLLVRREVSAPKFIYTAVLSMLVIFPFIAYNVVAYVLFCAPSDNLPESANWCTNFPPSIYTHVQARYWNVGFLKYWTLAQLPNFLIAAPPLVLLLVFASNHLKKSFYPRLPTYFTSSSTSSIASARGFLDPSLTPHVIHAAILCLTLILTAHTQIILRLAAALPSTYWAAAWLLVEHARWGKLWVTWSIVWGGIMCVLWAVFLPPA